MDDRPHDVGTGEFAPSEVAVASAKVAAIVEAAERAAEQLRLETEERVRARIAEADRAADLRVEAAEDEAREIVESARREAATQRAEAERALAQRRVDAEAEIEKLRDDGAQQARALVAEARAAARRALEEGTGLSGDLQDLGESLRRNAERLLRDVKLAHARLTADLDQADSPRARSAASSAHTGRGSRPERRAARGGDDLDVPEFLPGDR